MKETTRIAILVVSIVLFSCQPSETDHFDLLILNGKVVDGTGNPWYHGDVAIRADRVVAVGKFSGKQATKTIDASGKIVSPGFIDMLGQSEMSLLIDNRAVSKISQGITTEVTGEGESIAPQNERTLKEMKPFLDKYKLNVDWRDLEGYFRRLEQHKSSINLATFVGATQVREYVIGFDDREPTPQELEQMKQLVRESMQQGALGLSSSLIYAPATYAKTSELIELCKVVGQYGGMYCSHIRDEGNDDAGGEIKAVYEAADIARAAKVPVEIWHLKVAGKRNWGTMPAVVRLIEQHRSEGIDMTADQYPYIASANALSASIPSWAHDGGTKKLLERLTDKETRHRIRKELEERSKKGSFAIEGIMISTVFAPALKNLEGRLLVEIAASEKKDPIETLFDTVLADSARTGKVDFSMNEQDLRVAMGQPWVSFNTDYEEVAPDGPLSEGKPHPRTYGSFTRVLARYVREQKILTLEEAIRKMTSLPANRVGLKGRGILKPGFYADVVVFDPAKVIDKATFENPHQISEGIEAVIVNGKSVWEQGRFTGNLPGRGLRGPGYGK